MRPILGLMPAAGFATRLGQQPSSKEVLPVAVDGVSQPVCAPLLRAWSKAGIGRAIIILRRGKWDIPDRLGDGSEFGLDLSYLVVEETRSVPETLNRAQRWLDDCDVAIGFPDILLRPNDAWHRLVRFHREGSRDLSFGCFPCDRPGKADMVDLDADGRLLDLVVKDPECSYRWTWSIAIWTPAVSELMRRMVEDRPPPAEREMWVGDVLRAAVDAGLDVRGLRFEDGSFLDVGTPEDLAVARVR
ncbi:MAG: nucleotidyl transferase [Thermoanaerobaculia bacterium]|nr:nucleotidyl transferase [Thermoanaerobaculia bacterium]